MAEKRRNHRHTEEFSKRALSYESSNLIQKRVAQKLVGGVDFRPEKILDFGSGSGAVFQNISWPLKRFTAVDKAEEMCRRHPRTAETEIIHADFEDPSLFAQLAKHAPYDLIISSSALQWAHDLPGLFARMQPLGDRVAFAIFCAGTFKTVRKTAGLPTFLPEAKRLKEILQDYFDYRSELWSEKLYFPDNLSKFRYIKRSGVSGGRRRLTYPETKRLIGEYPLAYLEFEVLFVWGSVRR